MAADRDQSGWYNWPTLKKPGMLELFPRPVDSLKPNERDPPADRVRNRWLRCHRGDKTSLWQLSNLPEALRQSTNSWLCQFRLLSFSSNFVSFVSTRLPPVSSFRVRFKIFFRPFRLRLSPSSPRHSRRSLRYSTRNESSLLAGGLREKGNSQVTLLLGIAGLKGSRRLVVKWLCPKDGSNYRELFA